MSSLALICRVSASAFPQVCAPPMQAIVNVSSGAGQMAPMSSRQFAWLVCSLSAFG
jgi:hypothetical protein